MVASQRARFGRATLPLVLLLAASVVAAVDLRRIEKDTLVIYTTPALSDLLENALLPAFTAETGIQVIPVYVAAASEYHRVKLASERPEADIFLHASPLFLEKGYADGLFDAVAVPGTSERDAQFASRAVEGGHIWHAFAWSPLVEVHSPSRATPPDLADPALRLGLAHPRLSNNGIYNAVFFESLNRSAGMDAISRTLVQPSNARATIAGVAEGSYEATLGYEAVVRFFQGRGAAIAYGVPLLDGEQATLPVLFSAAVVKSHPHDGAEALVRFLFDEPQQAKLATYGFRSVQRDVPPPDGALDLAGVKIIDFDWSTWATLEAALPRYEVGS
ncbi:MAG: substrate-binding domain-containing protein [Candidatus Thermoplasmatota archaeon]